MSTDNILKEMIQDFVSEFDLYMPNDDEMELIVDVADVALLVKYEESEEELSGEEFCDTVFDLYWEMTSLGQTCFFIKHTPFDLMSETCRESIVKDIKSERAARSVRKKIEKNFIALHNAKSKETELWRQAAEVAWNINS